MIRNKNTNDQKIENHKRLDTLNESAENLEANDCSNSSEVKFSINSRPSYAKFAINNNKQTKCNSDANYDYENGTGELYMRAGTAIFSFCALVSHIIQLIQMMETFFNNEIAISNCKTTFGITIVSKVACVLFIFFQSFFIFKYANIVLHTGKNVAIIGLMHIICTNFCLFIRTVITETVAEMNHGKQHDFANIIHRNESNEHKLTHSVNDFTNTSSSGHLKNYKTLGCVKISVSEISKKIHETQEKIAEYLYPCVIEYSLLAMTIFYVLWSSFKSRYSDTKIDNFDIKPIEHRRKSVFQTRRASVHTKLNLLSNFEMISRRKENSIHESQEINKFTIDCGKATKG